MTMILTDELLMAIAQIAVALIGFSGVVVALGRGGNAWNESELLQLRTLVEPSLVVLTAVFVPFALSLLSISGEFVWRASNAVLLLLHLIGHSLFHLRGRNSDSAVVPSQVAIGTFCIAVYLLLLASVINIFAHHQFVFLLGLLIGILVSIHNFYLLLFGQQDKTASRDRSR